MRQIWLRQWLCAVLRHDLILSVGIGVRNDADQLPREMEACEGRQLIACVTAELHCPQPGSLPRRHPSSPIRLRLHPRLPGRPPIVRQRGPRTPQAVGQREGVRSGSRQPYGIVPVRYGGAEERNDGVADELLPGAADVLELLPQPVPITVPGARGRPRGPSTPNER